MREHVLSVLDSLAEGPSGSVDLPWPSLAGQIGPLQRGEVVVIGGRPGMGKTAFALNLAASVGRTGVHVALFSPEMSRDMVTRRLLAAEARVDVGKLRGPALPPIDDWWQRVDEALSTVAEMAIHIDDTPYLSLDWLEESCREQALRAPLGLVIVDYLQLMAADGHESREREIAHICRSLKRLAKGFDVPVVVLAQLSRECEKRADKRPMLSDLRDSGAIEQDADIVCLLHRPDAYANPDAPTGTDVAEVIVAKHRHGATGAVRLRFVGPHVRFDNIASDDGDAW